MIFGHSACVDEGDYDLNGFTLTLSRSFSLTKRRRILNGALNHKGAVTINTFFNLAG